MLRNLTIGFLAALGAIPMGLRADEPTAQHGTTRVVVYVVPQDGAETASEFATLVLQDETLLAELGSPLALSPTVPVPPLPDHLVADPEGPRAHLQRYLTLEYPTGVDLAQVLDRLRSNPRLGFVSRVQEGGLSAVVPNDDFYQPVLIMTNPEAQQWFYQQVDLENAWDYGKGYATVGAADLGIEVGHPDLQENLVLHQSWNFEEGIADPTNSSSRARGHGTHVAGILAADTDNLTGVAGSCWNCSLMMSLTFDMGTRPEALSWMAGNGAQILNLSGFERGARWGDLPDGIPCATTPPAERHVYCPLLDFLHQREIVFTVSSGNELRRLNFPANEPTTIAVGGTERDGELWDDRDEVTGCPDLTPPEGSGPFFQCGSNFGPEQDFAVPARQILSTFFHGWKHSGPGGCSDDPDRPNTFDLSGSTPTLGYDYCTGTSMSAPLMAGIFAQLRSLNPLLTIDDAKQALIETTAQGGAHNDELGYGIPQAGAAVERVLGTVDGQQVGSRLTPMFSLFSGQATNYLYTSKPQVASAAVVGTLHELPGSNAVVPYTSANAGALIAGYDGFPLDSGISGPTPVSSFYIFTSETNPFDTTTPLVPLYRLSFAEECDLRDHVYTTEQAGIDLFTGQSSVPDWCPDQPGDQAFRLDGIEGYILPECPPGFGCDDPTDPAEPQCLHRRSSQVDFGWALVLESELGQPPYESYTGTLGNSCIGYVFPNADSDGDGLVDGQELVLGTDAAAPDSDCDGLLDGIEVPLVGLPVSDPLDGVCIPPSLVITDNFDVGGKNPLDGRTTQSGGATWLARPGAILFGGRVNDSQAMGRVPFDLASIPVGDTVSLSADLNPASSGWTALGFSSGDDTAFWSDGPFWVLLKPNGTFVTYTEGQIQTQGTIPVSPINGYYALDLRYTRGSRKAAVLLGGIEVYSGTLAAEPDVQYAGFQMYLAAENGGQIDNFAITDVSTNPQALISDSFDGLAGALGDLDGRSTEVGGVAWVARQGAVLLFNRVTDAAAIAGIPLDLSSLGNGIASVSARLDPRNSNWIGLGFSSQPDQPFWSFGEFWVVLYPSGQYVVRAGGVPLQSGSVGASPSGHDVEVSFDTTTRKGTVTLGGSVVFAQTLAATPEGRFAGFHILASVEAGSTVDDFEARFDYLP